MNADVRAVILLLAFASLLFAIVVTPRARHLQPLTWVALGLVLVVITWLWDAAKAAGWW